MIQYIYDRVHFGRTMYEIKDNKLPRTFKKESSCYGIIRKVGVRTSPRVGRNEPCTCGSGIKL